MNTGVGMVVLLVLITASEYYANQISPSPSPEPNDGYGGTAPVVALTDERCSNSFTGSCHSLNHIIACLNISASTDSFLVVQNDGEDPLKVNITIVDIEIAIPEIQVPKHKAKKIKIMANIEGSPSIIIKSGIGKCTIPIGSKKQSSGFYKQLATHLSPIYGAYLLFFTFLIVGTVWVCCKIGKNEWHDGGVRYQELEMGQPESHLANDVEMAVGWNEGWDDDWVEQQEVKSPDEHLTENVATNGHNSTSSDKDGWGNDWDD
ncbi:hypothetical protein P3X46_025873 [Hevea brasiliensis]|uniref:DUF7356 domain-containing protein n=1 Tax=Hevea brasiliensis TaxID=3981 RepID=A0ABQ9L8S0_HEVBR|nr:uncharacterized protein LOC110633916 [Hevea brasiliensis]KAJ9160475.1 hypothetical protein P3X46_025873 [Hevea brasiliensis]